MTFSGLEVDARYTVAEQVATCPDGSRCRLSAGFFCFGDDREKRYVPRVWGDFSDLLAGKSGADEFWVKPGVAMTKKRKSPVEIAAAHANAMIVAVESDDGRNDGIEHPGGYDVTIHRFENTVAVRAKIRVGRYFAKLHLQIYFAHRGKNALFHSPCARDYFPGADLVGCRQIAREVLRALKPGGRNDLFCNDR